MLRATWCPPLGGFLGLAGAELRRMAAGLYGGGRVNRGRVLGIHNAASHPLLLTVRCVALRPLDGPYRVEIQEKSPKPR